MDKLLGGIEQQSVSLAAQPDSPAAQSAKLAALTAQVSSVIRHALMLTHVCSPQDASEISLGKFSHTIRNLKRY